LGLVGKSRYIGIDQYGFDEVITYYQNIDSTVMALKKVNRSGLIGNVVLNRFDLVAIDYTNNYLYLRPGSNYNEDFKYDKSGIGMIAVGPQIKNLRSRSFSEIYLKIRKTTFACTSKD